MSTHNPPMFRSVTEDIKQKEEMEKRRTEAAIADLPELTSNALRNIAILKNRQYEDVTFRQIHPAVQPLLAAKLRECGYDVKTGDDHSIHVSWALPMSAWEVRFRSRIRKFCIVMYGLFAIVMSWWLATVLFPHWF